MAVKKIVIDFKAQPTLGQGFSFRAYINGVAVVFDNAETICNVFYAASNLPPQQILLGADLNATINNTLTFLNTNYIATASVGGYNIDLGYARVGNTIEMILIFPDSLSPDNVTFFNIYGADNILLRPVDPCDNYYLSNDTLSSDNYALLNSQTSGTYRVQNVDLNTTQITHIKTRFNTLYARGFHYRLAKQITVLGNTFYQTVFDFFVPQSVSDASMTLYFQGNTLYIVAAYTEFLEYSLDGTTWQSEDSFADLAEGSYTVYVRDAYGCQKTFSITNSGTTNNTNDVTPFTDVSESNSIRFVKRVARGNCSGYRTIFNTLSCEENTRPAYKFTQLFQNCDTIQTQVRTSYQNVSVAAGNTEITANKIVSNIGISDKRDCLYYAYNGSLSVLFVSGNIYEYDTTTIIGTYELNGDLPPFGMIGTWVETPAGTFQIVSIRIDDSGQRSLILNSNNVSIAGNSTIQTIYNRDNYDIWEFSIDMSAFANSQFSVGVMFSQTEPDQVWPDVYWVSEKISVRERWANTLEIIWYNSKNTDVYFYSGIQFRARLALSRIWSLSDGDVEIQKTDTEVLSIDAEDYAVWSFEALGLTTGMKRKIIKALKHDSLFIEGVAYTLGESANSDNAGTSNMYKVTAKLFEKSDVWTQGNLDQQNVFGGGELIGLLGTENSDEFIKTI